MVRFSLVEEGDDRGVGPSNSKRQKIGGSAEEFDFQSPEEGEGDVGGERGGEGEEEVQDEEAAAASDEGCEQQVQDEGGDEIEDEDELRFGGAYVGSDPVSFLLTDPEVFDCPICLELLRPPIFQCENGHIACSLCCYRIGNKCPCCCLPIGYNRCRAIENVLESIRVSCPNRRYGCKKTLKFSEKHDHEQTCESAPCPCPLSGCHFVASLERLSRHVYSRHQSSVGTFLYNDLFHVSLNTTDRFVILQEREKGELFILKNYIDFLGYAVTVNRICANSSKGKLSYSLVVRNADTSLRLDSSTKNAAGQIDDSCSRYFLMVPRAFLGYVKHIKFEVVIWDENHGNGQHL